MTAVGLIPVRMASSRYPGKPLAPILGMSMVEHVYRRSLACRALNRVVIATCDEEIRKSAEAFGAPVVMTSDRHERAAERIAEAAQAMTEDVAVLIQGDEPLLQPDSLTALIAPLERDPAVLCTNLMLAIGEDDARDPDQVKVVLDVHGDAIYMSREAIPTSRYGLAGQHWRQIGLIAFRRAFLLHLMTLAPTPLERAESVDMNRAIEHGYKVRMVPMRELTYAVDTPADIGRVETLMMNDPFFAEYRR